MLDLKTCIILIFNGFVSKMFKCFIANVHGITPHAVYSFKAGMNKDRKQFLSYKVSIMFIHRNSILCTKDVVHSRRLVTGIFPT